MYYQSYLNDNNPVVTLKVKNHGTIVLQLFPEVAPNTVHNFIELVNQGFYTGLIFHRVIPHFMIQGGQGKEVHPIQGEFNINGHQNALEHTRGVISMARTNDPNSAGSQFFIMHHDAPHLDGSYAAFGGVIDGIEVVDAITRQPRDLRDRPYEDIVIESVTVDVRNQVYPKPKFYL